MSAGVVASLARAGTTQPVARPVPADDAAFRASKGDWRIARRVALRRLALAASGQAGRLRPRIDPAWKRLLWLHTESPQIGDALMDLAPRSLLVEHGLAVDLVAPPVIAALFRGDRWFGNVFDPTAAIDAAHYDAAIVDSFATRAVAAKRRVAPHLPWISVHGDYLAYDFQRALLATRRFAELLAVSLVDDAEACCAHQKLDHALHPLPLAAEGRGEGSPSVAIAVGGVRPERTYDHWPAVATALAAHGIRRFVLIGSANGRSAADAVQAALHDAEVDVDDLVAKTDLHRAQRAIASASLALCADGGLLHLALTTPTPVVALFDAAIDPAWRLPPRFTGRALRAATRDVDAVPPGDVVAAVLSTLDLTDALTS